MPSAVDKVSDLLPTYFIGHAGVNLLFDERPNNAIVQENLRAIGKEISGLSPKPKAIIVFSGHFESREIHGPNVIEVNVKKNTQVWHDFVNDFHETRPEVYEYEWPHTSDPELAVEVYKHLVKSGIKAKRVVRDLDHGVWVPFKLMFPEESPLDVPIIQVGTFHGYDLKHQIELGEAVQELRKEGYLIVGSGMAVHTFASLEEIRAARTEDERLELVRKCTHESRTLDNAIRDAVAIQEPKKRTEALLNLEKLYEFKRSHPTVEHFTPLLVVSGAAGLSSGEPLGQNVVEPAFTYLNVRFR